MEGDPAPELTSQPASTSQMTSQLAGQPLGRPVSQPASQPVGGSGGRSAGRANRWSARASRRRRRPQRQVSGQPAAPQLPRPRSLTSTVTDSCSPRSCIASQPRRFIIQSGLPHSTFQINAKLQMSPLKDAGPAFHGNLSQKL